MPQAKNLVCQYLEGISRKALEKYQGLIRSYTRHRPGVYALYRGRRLYWVGLASDFHQRLKQHLKKPENAWNSFSVYFTIGDAHLRELESLVLRIAKPIGVKQSGKFHKGCENLRRCLERDIKKHQQEELLELIGKKHREHETKLVFVVGDAKIPVLAPYTGIKNKAFDLRGHHKGSTFKARVLRGGTIRFNNESFASPSKAAFKALGRGCNGWWFWKYERAPGDWVRLDELRR